MDETDRRMLLQLRGVDQQLKQCSGEATRPDTPDAAVLTDLVRGYLAAGEEPELYRQLMHDAMKLGFGRSQVRIEIDNHKRPALAIK